MVASTLIAAVRDVLKGNNAKYAKMSALDSLLAPEINMP
jgi:hypothetical protein